MAWFRLFLLLFGASVVFLAAKYMLTGQRRYLLWAGRLIVLVLGAGAAFSIVLVLTRLL